MKRISFLLVTLALCAAPGLRAQDAANEERFNKLSGRVDDLSAAQEVIKKQLNDLSRDVENLRDQASKPTGDYVRTEALNRLADAIKEVDRKRLEDADAIRAELLKLRKLLEAPVPSGKKTSPTRIPKDTTAAPTQTASDKGFEYVIQSGDTLGAIVQAYKEKHIKVTVKQILDANPGLKPESLKVDQKIFIPAPQ